MTNSSNVFEFDAVGKVPAAGDNVAIATRRLEARTLIAYRDRTFVLSHTVLEGHRFVLEPTKAGGALLSWGLPFGIAIRDLQPGEYVCNERILRVLAERSIDFDLPARPNFEDHLKACELDVRHFTDGDQVERVSLPASFEGFRRPGDRGVGTRNFIIVLATTSQTTGFAQTLARRFEGTENEHPNLDGVVAVTHTEGGGTRRPNNLDFVLRTLAGFMVHDNVGAVLAVDYGTGAFTNDTLREFMTHRDYPLDGVLHQFFRINGSFQSELDEGEHIIRGWLPAVNDFRRSAEPLSHLKVALQCGGSDAFSGISGNALAGWVAKKVIRNGGSANLAETDELIGAEPYVLENTKDVDTARRFLETIEAFKERARHHGATAEGNPSGGNNFRGLYNIALKSIGAARKKDPEVRLDYVIEYAEPMRDRGYYFMDSPGNDLESIAGQVAAGSNVIFFITGNGSITNFPFVPTLKFVTTTDRFNMLSNEMDVNAGRYNDGASMEELGEEVFELARRVASGQRSKGEQAGHAQVQIWRDWAQTDDRQVEALRYASTPSGKPLAVTTGSKVELSFTALKTRRGYSCDQVGLIMPTSLCSGQVARLIAEHLNRRADHSGAVSRYVALVHTEGCGSQNAEGLYLQTLLGHLLHRFVRKAVLLEHGCEKTHNDAIRHYLERQGLSVDQFGWASVQLDGGINPVREKVVQWFDDAFEDDDMPESQPVSVDELRLGILTDGLTSERTVDVFTELIQGVVMGGGTVVIPETTDLARREVFKSRVLRSRPQWAATLAYGQPAGRPGLHVMEAPTENPVEVITGLGATGVEIMLAHIGQAPLQAHPMIALLQVSGDAQVKQRYDHDLDLSLDEAIPSAAVVQALFDQIGRVASREYTPKLYGQGNTNFQLTRGLLGLSL